MHCQLIETIFFSYIAFTMQKVLIQSLLVKDIHAIPGSPDEFYGSEANFSEQVNESQKGFHSIEPFFSNIIEGFFDVFHHFILYLLWIFNSGLWIVQN
jgi:hypothetical protein